MTRKREDIEQDNKSSRMYRNAPGLNDMRHSADMPWLMRDVKTEDLILEVLLDIRDSLCKPSPKSKAKPKK